MNKKSKDLRKVYQRLKALGKSVIEISNTLGVTRQTIYNWNKLSNLELYTEPTKNTRKPSIDLNFLSNYINDHPSAFNKEIALVLKCSTNTI